MDACSMIGESTDAIVMDDSLTNEKGKREASQSAIPAVSLCPPDGVCAAEAHLTDIQSEDDLGDSCSSLGRPSSSFQLYHQVPQGPSSLDYLSCQPRRCHCCGHNQTAKPSADSGRDSHPATAPHADCSAGSRRGCGSAHQAPCSSAVRCHWPHGSHDGGPRKPTTQRHVVTVGNGGLYWIPKCYSHVVVDHPLAVMVGCAIVLLGCSMAGLLIGPLPDFSDPLLNHVTVKHFKLTVTLLYMALGTKGSMGFEPRGTYIGVRQSCLTTLYENTGPGKALSLAPQPLRESNEGGFSGDFSSQEVSRQRPRRMPNRVSSQDTFLCDAPGQRYAQLVFRSGNSASLWSLKAIYSMCEIEQARIRSQAQFQELCLPHARAQGEEILPGGICCPSWSLGNYLAVLTNASSCLGLTSQQVSESLSLLRYCAPYYHNGCLVEACVEIPKHGPCGLVPSRCKQSHVVFQILHFLVDKDFLSPQTVEYQVPSLKYSLLFLPVDKGDHMMDIYLNSLEDRDLTLNNTTITGMDLGIKQTLFKYYLARDSVYPILAIVSLVFTMALYLKSLFVSVIALIAIITSLLSSYFFYKVVLRLTFFPLLNLSAALIVLGSCCNQVFTFVDFWNLQLSQNPSASLDKRVNRAMQEVGYLILASGLTSSVAFLSGYISSITAIRCFSVYLGTASLISSLLTLVWLPCSLILCERYTVSSAASAAIQGWKPCCSKNSGGFWDTSSRKRCLFTLGQKLRGLKRGVTDTSNLLFLKILPCGVVKFRYIWLCWFAVLAAGGTYISCIDPGMKLPTLDNRVTQLFRSSHPFERYDAEYRHMFMFERQMNGEDKPVTITLVWGVNPLDNGNHLNPKSNGSLVLDTDFNMSSPNAQVWLRDLCGRVQNLSFYFPLSEDKSLLTDNVCLVEQLIHWVSARRCSEAEDAFHFCCNNIPFPYSSRVFEQCLSMMLAERQAEGHLAFSGGPYFKQDGRIAALVLAFKTTYRYSFNFSRTSIFYKEILTWFNREIAEAPSGLDRGWFIGQFSLFDLQQCLSSETLLVAGSSIALTFVSLFLTTWNILLSIYGTVAVGGSVFVTVGLLVLLEWELSGIEALFISAAAGLSVDFIANYCVSYSSAPHSDRIGRVAHSTKRMGCPVAIGSSMFFFIGIIMLPATALLFRKLGIFLFLVKCVACGFATFFFQSLCCFFGPQKNVGKIMLPCSSEPSGDNVLSSCTTAEPNSSAASAANGAFGRCRVRRNYDKDASGYLYPNNHRQQRQKQHGAAGVGGARVAEQYELQPLAYRLSDSFENSTCTSKLSNRPSVLSDEIEYCGRDVDRNSTEADSEEMCSCQGKACHPPPALQTSSPYRENTLRPVAQPQEDLAKVRLLCNTCRDQSSRGVEQWRSTSSTSSSMEETVISQTLETIDQLSLNKERQDTGGTLQQIHKRLRSFQSQSSADYLEDSSETRLSDTEPRPSNTQHPEDDDSLCQPGHLNGKRDTLRLSLKETVYETSLPGSGKGRTSQSEEVVILPNSKPDLPDVWIKRDGQREDTF